MDMTNPILFAKAALIGLSIAAPVGPIGLLCIQRTLEQGPRAGLAAGLGAASADALYGALGAWGVSALIALLSGARVALGLGGALFLLWLAWGTWRGGAGAGGAVARPGRGRPLGIFAATFALTLANPATILSFVAIFSTLAAAVGAASPAWMVAGVFAGSAAWWLVLVACVARLRHAVSPARMRWIRRGSALVLGGFAALQLVMLARGLAG
ncbi:LysE family transporter [Cupriavidus sp. USMAA2-4]|uniref:LysE family transporter n=1 Tax=Cupriavidus sp. USMAA2-4 TaxID=876364 RepID=UPI0018DB2194|nr:LysE family transporter [Cupriavidus sp. USMAA2-4]